MSDLDDFELADAIDLTFKQMRDDLQRFPDPSAWAYFQRFLSRKLDERNAALDGLMKASGSDPDGDKFGRDT